MALESPLLQPTRPACSVPGSRIRLANEAPVRPGGNFVLYWMTAFRRLERNFALQRAIEWCRELDRGLVVLEALRSDYPWACRRFHAFVVQGMQEHEEALRGTTVRYFPYLEPEPGAGQGLLATLAESAAVVVGDDWPCFFHPRMQERAAVQLTCRFELVDSNGVTPLAELDKTLQRAFSLRKILHRNGPRWLAESPDPEPLTALAGGPRSRLPAGLSDRWAPSQLRRSVGTILDELAIPDGPAVVPDLGGGTVAARERLETWVQDGLRLYGTGRNHPDEDAASGLSPWLHFGMISAHEVLARVRDFANRSGKDEVIAGAESFADELITWRELGHQYCRRVPDYDSFETLPDWARKSLDEHASDPREEQYELSELASAATSDEIWNAAQRQLVDTGRMHNYLRMLWGKKVLQWSPSPRVAWERLIELNNRYALDGRDPNSYAGISWVFGRFDRAWGPERPIFGLVRYMTSESTRKKLRLRRYLERYAG